MTETLQGMYFYCHSHFYKWTYWDVERLSHTPRATELVNDGVETPVSSLSDFRASILSRCSRGPLQALNSFEVPTGIVNWSLGRTFPVLSISELYQRSMYQSSLTSPSASLALWGCSGTLRVHSKYLLNWIKLKVTIVLTGLGVLLYALLVSSSCLYSDTYQKFAVVVYGLYFFLRFVNNIPLKWVDSHIFSKFLNQSWRSRV